MSAAFDKKFENWLSEQLQSIKSLTGIGNQVRDNPTPREHSQLQHPSSSAIYQSIFSRYTHSRRQTSQTSAVMSRTNRPDVTNKHGGNYYRFAYDEDDVQSFDDVTVEDDLDNEDDETRRRERLTRILGDECIDFGSEIGFEMEDEITARTSTAVPTFDENRNLAESRVNNYSTTSLEFSDVESFVSATASDVTGIATPIRFSGDWAGVTDDIVSGVGSLDGFIEFSRVRDEKTTVHRPLTLANDDDDDDDDPLRYGLTKPLANGAQPRQLPTGLLAAISGRINRPTDAVNNTSHSGGDRRMKEMIAVRFHKTERPGGELSGDDFMDDDDMIVHPQRYQLPVSDARDGSGRGDFSAMSRAGAASAKDIDYIKTRGFLPVDLSMDIMSADDAFSAADFDDGVSDDVTMHSKDREPIVKTPSYRHSSAPSGSPGTRSLPHKFIWSLSDATTFDDSRTGNQCCRRTLIMCGVVSGILLLVGIGVGIFFVRYKQ